MSFEDVDEQTFLDSVGELETDRLDFKEALPRCSKLQEPVVAFYNAKGGRILVGVTEGRPRRVVGIAWNQRAAERVEEVSRSTSPPIPIAVKHQEVGGRTVLILGVAPAESGWAHHSDGRLIVRAGPTNRTLVHQELTRFIRERGSEAFEEEAVRGVTLDDLRNDLLRKYIQARLGRTRLTMSVAARPWVDYPFREGQVSRPPSLWKAAAARQQALRDSGISPRGPCRRPVSIARQARTPGTAA